MPTCAAHNVETSLRCGKCDKPICPDCMLIGPAGTRCRECASVRSSPLFQVSLDRLAIGVAAGLAAATVGGYLLAAAFRFGFFLFWIGLLAGTGVGEAILRSIHRRRGPKVEAAAVGTAIAGCLLGIGLWFLVHGFTPTPEAVAGFIARNPFYLVGAGAMIFGAQSRTRFF